MTDQGANIIVAMRAQMQAEMPPDVVVDGLIVLLADIPSNIMDSVAQSDDVMSLFPRGIRPNDVLHIWQIGLHHLQRSQFTLNPAVITALQMVVGGAGTADERVEQFLAQLAAIHVGFSAVVVESDEMMRHFHRRLGVDEFEAIWKGVLAALRFEMSVVDAGVYDDPTPAEDYGRMWRNSIARGGMAHRYLAGVQTSRPLTQAEKDGMRQGDRAISDGLQPGDKAEQL